MEKVWNRIGVVRETGIQVPLLPHGMEGWVSEGMKTVFVFVLRTVMLIVF